MTLENVFAFTIVFIIVPKGRGAASSARFTGQGCFRQTTNFAFSRDWCAEGDTSVFAISTAYRWFVLP